jgi:hypothetical protein
MASEHSSQLSPPPLRLTRQRLEPAGSRQLEELRSRFDRDHLVRLPRFLDDDLLTDFHRRAAQAPFTRRVEEGIEIEETLDDPILEALLLIPLNDPALFEAVSAVAGCGRIGCFSGRIFRRRAASSHYYPWHSDATQDRVIGLSLNLGRTAHAGGVLQLRSADTRRLISETANTAAGDAVLFRIAEDIEHHVTPVTGSVPRLVLAGWFRRSPDFWARLSRS